MEYNEYSSLVLVSLLFTTSIVLFSWLCRRKPILINLVFIINILLALFTYSFLLHKSFFDTFGVLIQIVVGPSASWTRICVVLFWILNVIISLGFCYYIESVGSSNTIHRKFFHLTVSAIYISGIVFDPSFTWICGFLWLCIFILIELLRYMDVPPWSTHLNQKLLVFKDAQDSELLLTPIYLLVGIFLPLLISFKLPIDGFQPKLYHFAGVAAVGVGDSSAAIIGSMYGRTKWNNSHKSLEGTFAMLFSILLFLNIVNQFIIAPTSIIFIIMASIITSLSEAYIEKMDNIILPLIAYFIL